ncbi:hypothetical protein A3194_19235 [Candidatus Thiodiazotropha endoloripes]|nr:hypothetical protein A3194_19235 [Candidatus Thiodiazotropha endoloripes]
MMKNKITPDPWGPVFVCMKMRGLLAEAYDRGLFSGLLLVYIPVKGVIVIFDAVKAVEAGGSPGLKFFGRIGRNQTSCYKKESSNQQFVHPVIPI